MQNLWILIFLAGVCVSQARDGQPYGEDVVKGELLVRAKSRSRVMQIFSKLDHTVGPKMLGYYKVKFKEDTDLKGLIHSLKSSNDFHVQPNYIYRTAQFENLGNRFSSQWSFVNHGTDLDQKPDADMDIDEAWELIAKQKKPMVPVKVAIIDTGIDLTSSNFLGQVDIGKSFSFVRDKSDVSDFNGHGSHVAGVIAGRHSIHSGVRGINQNVDLVVVQALNRYGMGSTEQIIKAVMHAVDQGSRVINASYGGGFFDQAAFEAYSYANEKGVVVVAAAGNSGLDNDVSDQYPCNYDLPNIISVGSTNAEDGPSYFSNYGAKSVDVFAPGSSVLSASVSLKAKDEKIIRDIKISDVTDADFDRPKPYNATAEQNGWSISRCDSFESCLNFSPVADFKPTEEFTNFEITFKEKLAIEKSKNYILKSLYRGDLSWASGNSNYTSAAIDAGESEFWMLPAAVLFDSASSWTWQETNLSEPGFFYSGTSMWEQLRLGLGFSFSFRDSTSSFDISKTFYEIKQLQLIEQTPYAESKMEIMSGTSMAAPHITGVVSAMLGLKPDLSVAEIKRILIDSCDPIAELKEKSVCGGRVNMRRSIEQVLN